MGRTDTAKILFKRATAAAWVIANPVLLNGEPGYETDTGKVKIGDGVKTWTQLSYLVGSGGGAADGYNIIAAGTQTAGTAGTVQFSNANGLTFGMSNSVVTGSYTTPTDYISTGQSSLFQSAGNYLTTQTVQTQGTFNTSQLADYRATSNDGQLLFTSVSSQFQLLANSTLSLGTGYTTHTHGYLSNATVFSNSNNVTFGLNGSTITASASYPAATSATFSNSNNVTFGVNAGVVTASASFAGGAGGNILAAGTRTAGSNSSVLFSNANGVTFGLDTVNGSIMTASVAAVGGAQTGISGMALSNTTYTSGTVSFRDGNGVSWASGTGQGVSLTHGLQFTSNTSAITSNALNTSQSSLFQHTSATSAITSNALHSSASRVFNIVAATNNTGGGTASVSSNVSFSNANGITFYTSAGGAVVASYTVPSTAGFLTTAMLSNASTQFVQANAGFAGTNASGTIASNGISISVAAPGGGGGAALKGSGTYTQNTGTVEFANSNGITFGLSNNGTMTASHNGLTTARASNDAVGLNTALTANGVSWTVNSSGLSLNVPAFLTTAQPVGAYLTTARASNDAIGLNTAQTNVTWTVNSSGISINAGGYLTSQSNQAYSGANGSATFQTLSFANSNGVSFSTGTQGLFATVATNYQSQGAYLTTARASNDAIGLNTAQTNVTWTVNSSGLSLNAAGYAGTGLSLTNATATLNSNGLQLSVAAGGGVSPVASASNGSFSFTTLGFSNANNVTFGTSAGSIITASVAAPGAAAENNWVNLIGANTAGNTTASGSTIAYSGINLTLSGTNGSVVNISAPGTSSLSATGNFSISVNGSTISMGVPVPEIYHWDNMGVNGGGIAGSSGTINVATNATKQNTVQIFPIGFLDGSITVNTLMFQMSHSASGNSSSAPKVFSISFGLYTRNGSTLSLLNSASKAYSIAANAAASTAFSGIRWINIEGSLWSGGAAPTLSAGVNYYGAMVYSSGGNNSAAQTAGFLGFYPFMTAANSGVFGVSQTTASTLGFYPWLGVHATTGAIPTSIGLTQITRQGASANFIPHIVFNNLNSYY